MEYTEYTSAELTDRIRELRAQLRVLRAGGTRLKKLIEQVKKAERNASPDTLPYQGWRS